MRNDNTRSKTTTQKAQLAQVLGDETLIAWVAIEQARIGLDALHQIAINREAYGEMIDLLTLMQVNLESLQNIELLLLYNPFIIHQEGK